MKFSSSLKFNAVSEWWDEYLAYDALKKKIYELERQQVGLHDAGYHDLEANEETSLIGRDLTSLDSQFSPLLNRELRKICLFYESQEKELLDDVHELQNLIQQQEDIGPDGQHQYSDGEDDHSEDEEDEDDFDIHALNSPTMSRDDTLTRSATSQRRRRRSRSESTGGVATSEPARRRARAQIQRRYSISSSEDHGDLEASLASLRSAEYPAGSQLTAPGTGRGGSTSRSPMRTARTLANKIFSKDTATSNFPAPETIWNAKSNYAWDVQLLFKRRITNLYLTASSLRAYVELNYSGFRKI
ncbi:hypothetical protein QCA50_006296 [Cerrena zonata]|uniref:SPX domain-containing protein n=1 Tax=Cerrena zonata TaxID=2478898 RepID=A0AAW0GCD0_9APHY